MQFLNRCCQYAIVPDRVGKGRRSPVGHGDRHGARVELGAQTERIALVGRIVVDDNHAGCNGGYTGHLILSWTLGIQQVMESRRNVLEAAGKERGACIPVDHCGRLGLSGRVSRSGVVQANLGRVQLTVINSQG